MIVSKMKVAYKLYKYIQMHSVFSDDGKESKSKRSKYCDWV